MRVLTGSHNSAGCPTIRVSVWGVYETLRRDFGVMIDTGFSGFLSMPLVSALQLGFVLRGSTTVELADGATHDRLTALATVELGGTKEVGITILRAVVQ